MLNFTYLIFFFVFLFSWINNIIILIQTNLEPLTTLLILRVIGIFMFPLGAILGFV